MPVDEQIANKSSEEVTGEDVREILKAPPEDEQPLIDPNVFDEKQPDQPIYKSIPLKFALAGVPVFIIIVGAIGLFSGNLFSGANKPTQVAGTEAVDATETEEEKAQRLVAEENADLKRKLALQNQSFTAQEIDSTATGTTGTTTDPTQKPIASSSPQQPVPASRPVSAVASRPVQPRSTPTRTSVSRAPFPPPTTARPTTPVTSILPQALAQALAQAPKEQSAPMSLAEIADAGNYGQLPSGPISALPSAQTEQAGFWANSNPSVNRSPNRDAAFARASSIPVSTRSKALPPAPQASTHSAKENLRPIPTVMKENASANVSAVPEALEVVSLEEIALDEADSYEAHRDLIMGPTEIPNHFGASSSEPSFSRTSSSMILPGSTAELEVTTALTWASDLPRALGSVTLMKPLVSDGSEVLPQGTELIVQIGELSESGAVSLNVMEMVLPSSGEMANLNIPAGALAILAIDGGYPVARAEQSSEQQLQAIDRQQALLGAMGAAGDYLNRPQRETNLFGIGGSSTSREYGTGSLWGSLLSGAANEMLRSRNTRLDAEAENLAARPTLWSIESGRRLQLFVTQEIEL